MALRSVWILSPLESLHQRGQPASGGHSAEGGFIVRAQLCPWCPMLVWMCRPSVTQKGPWERSCCLQPGPLLHLLPKL